MEANEFERPQSEAELEAQALLEEKPKENVLLGIVGALLSVVFGIIERRLCPWREEENQ